MSSKSKFWSSLPLAEGKDEKEGIISLKQPFDFPFDKIVISETMIGKIITDQEITRDDLHFILENGTTDNGNSFVIDPKLSSHNVVVKLFDQTNQMLGFIFSIPCTLSLKKKDDSEMIESSLTTFLSVSEKHRSKELAKYLIAGAIDYGYRHSIYTGYHFIRNPKTPNNLLVMNYYRPLQPEMAIEFGYEVPSLSYRGTSYSLDHSPTPKQLSHLEKDYSASLYPEYIMKKTEFSDLAFLQMHNRKLSVAFSAIRFEQMKDTFEFYTFWKGREIVGLVIYKTMVLHVARIQKGCPNASIVLLEMKEKDSVPILSNLFRHLQSRRFVVMNGVILGTLSDVKLRDRFGFVTCGIQYLDFYNLSVKLKDPSRINLLYL